MKDPSLAAEIVRSVCRAVSIPVSVKMRSGYDGVTAPGLAPLLEEAGASFITVHGRTRDAMYRPPADLDAIREVKRRVSVPVIGNGDVASPAGALHMLEYTGCDAVAVGRGALGDPFIFARINAVLLGSPEPASPTPARRMDMLRRHVSLMCRYKGEYIALREARRHAGWYVKGLRGAAAARARACELSAMADLDGFIEMVLSLQRD
jgi:nifR3 family TIM-barrel protein